MLVSGVIKRPTDAKSALDLPRVNVGVPYTDFKRVISRYIFSTTGRSRKCRNIKVVLCLARISHTHETHSHILERDPSPRCEHRQSGIRCDRLERL